MRVGVCSFTIRHLQLTPLQTLDLAVTYDLAGVQFGTLGTLSATLDPGELGAIKRDADGRGLYTLVSLSLLNPHRIRGDREAYLARLQLEIERCADAGWFEVRAALGGGDDRFGAKVPWTQQLHDCATFIGRLAPVLRERGVRIALENHADITSFELVRLIEALGDDILGACLDTANLFCTAEAPLDAARRLAPYVRFVHVKDAVVYLSDAGLERQVRPVGQGVVPWRELLEVLGASRADMALSIEDHQENPGQPDAPRTYGIPIFDPEWRACLPDLSARELAGLVQLAYRTGRRIRLGELSPPEAFFAPWEAGGVARLLDSAVYLKDAVAAWRDVA